MIKLAKFKPNPSNPRKIKDDRFEKLQKSLKEFPAMMSLRPIIVDSNGIVIGGNQRFRALKSLGYKEVPEEWIKYASDLSKEEINRFIIIDNEEFGQDDWEMLQGEEWDIETLEDWGKEIDHDFETVTFTVKTSEKDLNEGRKTHICPNCNTEFDD